ncbi:hypothetical protein CGMCC3_g9673 [Colletotrichum fructicola]|uniref:Heterokaryon incompatibility domain-containing protein n=1 Tax=Colletotrichum fructicola (strain Nara gc5) TaxID=1213859 RepID=A0A7J6IE41_COLFN|nr:uncharacterized protein CGMCC3_g9673 [Colletotrichum fructicola]KAE9574238.1 hypothetical protein CGMCC3_g9673 [Colletotrichum fructicola]KAF4474512.1 hypothetical protein CGGC5_v016751 [Colletotrichum fructicola Nara gc5]
MPEGSPKTMESEEILSSLARSQTMFAETLARGTVPVDKEIEMRADLAKFCIQVGTAFSNQQAIDDAIQHVDTILRRIPDDSPDRPKFLHELSKAKFELYLQTDSQHSLNLAVFYGRQARELAVSSSLREHDLDTYLEILTNLGYVLVSRFRLRGMPRDIEESIACKREILGETTKGSEPYFLALSNLASSLHIRYMKQGGQEDEEEAQQLLQELLSSIDPGSKIHNAAIGQLGAIAISRPTRHEYTQSLQDMDSVVQYSCLLFESTPVIHSSRGEDLLEHLRRIQQCAFAKQSIEAVDSAIEMSRAAFARMPEEYQDKERSQLVFTHLLSQRYVFSNQVEDLISLSEYTASMIAGYNAKIRASFGKQEVHEKGMWRFTSCLKNLAGAPVNSPMRQLAEEELMGAFLSCFDLDSKQYGPSALETIYLQNGKRLGVLAAAAEADIILSDDEIEAETTRVKSERAIGDIEFLENLFGRPSEYKTELGLRKLAIDPETNHIPFDFGNLARHVLEYEDGPVSPAEFIAREERMETASLEKGRLEGSFHQALRQGWEADTAVSLQTLLDDRHGPVYNTGEQQVNLDLIRAWLRDCNHNHGSICNHPRPGKRITTKIPLTFIDVVQQCLVFGTSKDKYFALSYTWGQVDMCMTLEENFEGRQHPQALAMVPFPKSIRDAMTLVGSLGIRLLWIDAICIVQDDAASKARDIPNMDIIYGRAFATIVALSGNNADAGLPGVNPGTRSVQRIETIAITRGSSDLDHDPLGKDTEIVNIVRTPRPFYLALRMSNWNTRGWIMQERLLSRRCIYFSPEAVYFQCGKSTLAEGGVNEEYKTYFLSAPMKDDHLLRKANHDNPISDLSQMHELETGPKLWKAFKTYMELVCNYSKRQFTFKPDVLNGFAGIFAVLDEEHFQGSIKSTTLHGIPSGIFIHALLWSPAARIPRRGTRFPTQNDFTTGNPDPKFPSWSWAGTSAPLIRIFHLGSLEVFPDKYEEAGSLLEKFEKERDGMQAATPVDKAAEERPPGGLEQSAPAGNTEPSILIPSTSQGDPGIDEKGDEGKKEPKGKGKEKATEDAPRTGTLWHDPDSKKLWLWFTPPGYEEARKRDPPAPENVLRMTGPVVPLIAFKIAAHKEYLTLLGHVHTQGSQSVRRIFDSDNKHCGLYWEQGGYEWVGNGIKPESEKRLFMLGVSAYGVCYRPREGPSRVEGPIKLFDEEAFPDKGPGSGLVNVLVIDEDVGYPDSTGDRCTIAIIHRAAWEAAGPVEREVRIA